MAEPEGKKPQGFEGTGDSTGPVSLGLALQAEQSTSAEDFFLVPRNPVTF